MGNFFETHASSEYSFKLTDFEGPLDLLLSLIKDKDANLNILEIKISDITDQYMRYMEDIDSLDMEVASDFISMASTLLEIKSNSVLPRVEEEYDEEYDDYDPEEELRRQLFEYDIFKRSAQLLRELETLNRFYREPVYTDEDIVLTVKNFNFDKLIEAYAFVLAREPMKAAIQPKHIERDKVTVAEKITYLADILVNKKVVNFNSLFDNDATKDEVISTFLALLQLLKRQIAVCDQEEECGEIVICIKENYDLDDIKDIGKEKEADFVE